MPRFARIVMPGVPHHVTQRGNRRQQTFFTSEDYEEYLNLLGEWSRRASLSVWAYCLMPNHVHLLVVPEDANSLRQCISQVHCRYTRMINFREKWRGYLWQGRFASFPMDDSHMLAAARYILLNPVRAKLVDQADEWPYSSIHAHLKEADRGHARISRSERTGDMHVISRSEIRACPRKPLAEELVEKQGISCYIDDWNAFLYADVLEDDFGELRFHERTGRPLGSESFLERIAQTVGGIVRLKKRGRKKQKTKRRINARKRRKTGD
ncbi:MAG: transposase [Planctomycetota bacterium]|nr:MAG: transposase [Planctomycetota bacterium]